MKGTSRSTKISKGTQQKKTRTSTSLHGTSKLSGMLSSLNTTSSRAASTSSSYSAPTTTFSRGYVTKHTHFHTWKPEVRVSDKLKEARAARNAVRIFSKEQFERTRKPFGVPVITKLPISQRKPSNKQLLDSVNDQELKRLQQLPREIDPFNVGDQVAVTALLSMTENKTQVYKGTVIQSTRKHGLHGRFTLRNNSDGGFYEVTFPFWSPFLRKIELIQKDPEPLVGKTKQALYHRSLPADHPKNKVL